MASGTVSEAVAESFAGDLEQVGGLVREERGSGEVVNANVNLRWSLSAGVEGEGLEGRFELSTGERVAFETFDEVADVADDSIQFGGDGAETFGGVVGVGFDAGTWRVPVPGPLEHR